MASPLSGSSSGSARNDGTCKGHFIRRRVQFSDVNLSAGVKIGRLPKNAFIAAVKYYTSTVFNSGTSDTLQLGSTAGGVDILAATTVHSATGYTSSASAAGLGLVVTNTAEVDVFVKWVAVGTAATTGDVTIIVDYSPDNDQ